MKSTLRPLTPKQKQLQVRKRLLISFRRFLSLRGTGGAVYPYLDMNALELRASIESKWLLGMSWDNYGTFWVVDHVVGLAFFDVFNENDMKLCWSYHNLNPSYYIDNHLKGHNPETAEKLLSTMYQSVTVRALREKIKETAKFFQPYYQRTISAQ